MKIGGAAAIGGLAWKAYQDYQRGKDAAATADKTDLPRAAFDRVLVEPLNATSRSLLIMRAMITAASADGHLDPHERERIFTMVSRLDLTTEEKGLLFDEMRVPLSPQQLAHQVRDEETAIEAYAAALLAIDTTRPKRQKCLPTWRMHCAWHRIWCEHSTHAPLLELSIGSRRKPRRRPDVRRVNVPLRGLIAGTLCQDQFESLPTCHDYRSTLRCWHLHARAYRHGPLRQS
ncbi:MAG: tellurite resistance TerB family protein [Gammaproteobacteria bacterium]|nr:tellurite resistance TerB family protein [Gammaproteobacteria bacterium]